MSSTRSGGLAERPASEVAISGGDIAVLHAGALKVGLADLPEVTAYCKKKKSLRRFIYLFKSSPAERSYAERRESEREKPRESKGSADGSGVAERGRKSQR